MHHPSSIQIPGNSTLGQRLKVARIRAGYLKARDVAKALDIAANTYYRYERDESVPTRRVRMKLQSLLNMSPTELLDMPSTAEPYSPAPASTHSAPVLPNGGLEEPVRDYAPEIAPQAHCSLLAWRLAAALTECVSASKQTSGDDGTRILALYFDLLRTPAAALMPFNTVIFADQRLGTEVAKYLGVYHEAMEQRIGRNKGHDG